MKESIKAYTELLKARGMREQIVAFLSEFISTDARTAPKQMEVKDGGLSVLVDENTIESFRGQLVDEIDELTKQMESS